MRTGVVQRWRLFENDHAGKLEMVTSTPKLRQVTPNRAMADHEEEPGQGEENFVNISGHFYPGFTV